jgi:signal transduction histidine kinase
MNSKRRFSVDARTLLSLGRESIKDHTTALTELVKNSYDADATHVEIEICSNGNNEDYIRIADDGDGMDSDIVNTQWLRIGYSEKRKKTISAKGRRETGEKGIGRLSADRLGSKIELRSKTEKAQPVGISVDWDQFNIDGQEISDVPIAELKDSVPKLPNRGSTAIKGTELRIKSLRQDWSNEDIKLLSRDLSFLVPPKVNGKSLAKTDFTIWLKANDENSFTKLQSPFLNSATLEFHGSFSKNGELTYSITRAASQKGKPRIQVGPTHKLQWEQLAPDLKFSKFSLGQFAISLQFFLRSEVPIGVDFTLSKLKEYLDDQGGIKVYRDGIRVKPYGDPHHNEGDWLGLAARKIKNPAGAGRKSFSFGSNQVLGDIHIGRDKNPLLKDGANREGLIHNDEYTLLKACVLHCIMLMETEYNRLYLEKKDIESSSPQQQIQLSTDAIKNDLAELKDQLTTADRQPGTGRASAKLMRTTVERLSDRVEQVEKEIEELANQGIVFRGLATVGISAAVFAHETENALDQAKSSTSYVHKKLHRKTFAQSDIEICQKEIIKSLTSIDRISLWGQFALARVKRDKRRRIKLNVSNIVTSLVNEIEPLMTMSSIQIIRNIKNDISLKAFAMDIESATLNLLTNAYHAVSLTQKNRKVSVSLGTFKEKGKSFLRLDVSDSGPGVLKEYAERIWQPLFSTKIDGKGNSIGTGLGLTIVKSVVDELGGRTNLVRKGSLGGASFEIIIPLE